MLSFKNFLSESVSTLDFEKLKSFAKLANPTSLKMTARYLAALDVFAQAIKLGEISKNDYEGLKYAFNHFFESTSSYMLWNNPETSGKLAPHKEELGYTEPFYFRKSKDAIEYSKKVEKYLPEYTEFVKHGLELYLAFAPFKDKIIKRVKKELGPKVDIGGKEVYMKKMASKEAIETIHKILLTSFDQVRTKLYDTYKKMNQEDLEKLKGLVAEQQPKGYFEFAKKNSKRMNSLYLTYYGNYTTLSDKADKIVEKITKDTVTMLEEFFLTKNIQKLSIIFERKSGLKDHKIVSNKVDPNGILENTMDFVFDDNSKFRIYTKVEYVFNTISGKPFIRMPTRFTDVYMADGSKMSQPSEEKMDKEF